MEFILTEKQLKFLLENTQQERPDLYNYITAHRNQNHTSLDIDEEVASEIRDWAGEKLQVCGFDLDYNLTSEGKILEDIIDILYV